MKKLIKVGIISLVAIISLTGCGCSKKENKKTPPKTSYVVEEGAIINDSNNITKDQKIDGLTFSNTSLIYQGNVTIFETTVTNTTDSDYNLDYFYISIKGKKDKELTRLLGSIGGVINPGKSVVVTAMTDMDLSKAVSIEYLDFTKK